ncbi:hypothetical protein CCICO_03850 [Corynebacterium ciconiae DSM 44920]|nr:hypothetical protein CCICO_03850 [Corynebacterium ciconiae DSM 44920]
MPIMPIWWSEQTGVGLSVYLAGMAIQGIVSLLIDFPLSFWSDKTEPRIPYAVGLGMFALAFVASAIGGFAGFVAYLVGICLAGALISGTDTALLLELAKERFSLEIFELNRRFYLYTSGLFPVGVALYLVSPTLLFAVQALCLIAAGAIVATLAPTADRTPRSHEDIQSGRCCIGGRWRISPTLVWVAVVVAVCCTAGEFEAANQLLNRSLQIVVAAASIPGIDRLWTVAGVLVITNVLATLGLGQRARRLSSRHGLCATLVALTVGTLASLMFINSGVLPVIIFGAVLMGVMKGVYRPLFSTLAVQTLPAAHWKARWLSLTGMFSSLVSSIINIAIVVNDPSESELIWRMALQLLCIVIPALIALSMHTRLAIPLAYGESKATLTRRVTILGHDSTAWLEQTYPAFSTHMIAAAVHAPAASGLPHPRVLCWENDRIESEFIDGTALSEVEPCYRWSMLEQHGIFAKLCQRDSRVEANLPAVGASHYAHECAQICTCPAVSHGNVSPDTVIVTDTDAVLVNWENGGNGSRALDELALLSHPHLEATADERCSVYRALQKAHNCQCPIHALSYQEAATRVLTARIADIRDTLASSHNSEHASELLTTYEHALRSL